MCESNVVLIDSLIRSSVFLPVPCNKEPAVYSFLLKRPSKRVDCSLPTLSRTNNNSSPGYSERANPKATSRTRTKLKRTTLKFLKPLEAPLNHRPIIPANAEAYKYSTSRAVNPRTRLYEILRKKRLLNNNHVCKTSQQQTPINTTSRTSRKCSPPPNVTKKYSRFHQCPAKRYATRVEEHKDKKSPAVNANVKNYLETLITEEMREDSFELQLIKEGFIKMKQGNYSEQIVGDRQQEPLTGWEQEEQSTEYKPCKPSIVFAESYKKSSNNNADSSHEPSPAFKLHKINNSNEQSHLIPIVTSSCKNFPQVNSEQLSPKRRLIKLNLPGGRLHLMQQMECFIRKQNISMYLKLARKFKAHKLKQIYEQ